MSVSQVKYRKLINKLYLFVLNESRNRVLQSKNLANGGGVFRKPCRSL